MPAREPITADTITDEQIRELDRDRATDHDTIEDALSTRIHHMLRAAARTRCAEILNARARRHGALHPFCHKCGWRKGGIDSWDGVRCKCGHSEPARSLGAGLPMSVPVWLRSVFADCEACALDHQADREFLAAAIIAKLTELAKPFAGCIASAARAHFVTRGITDVDGGIAKQIAANGATSILMLLESE